jgi:hypothetical protein
MSTVTEPSDTFYALKFSDGIAAGEFATQLGEFLRSPGGTRFLDERRAQVWITAPRRGVTKDDFCCVYLREGALEAVRAAGLDAPDAERVRRADLPEQRVLVIGEVDAKPGEEDRGQRAERGERARAGDPSLHPGA